MRRCLECGTPLDGFRTDADFCTRECRNAFNNRRASRGAELYDLIMVARFERHLAKRLRIWGWIARLASAYRDEDRHERAGRASWRPPSEIVGRRPWIAGRVMQRGRAA